MTNPPLTFIINVMTLMSMIVNTPEIMIPANIGALATGSTVAHMFPNKVADKYTKGNTNLVKIADVAFHWLPTVSLLYWYRERVNKSHVAMALALPLVYFSVKHTENSIKPVEPIQHIKDTYPGVPLWVFSLYVAGALSTIKIQQ